jgi:hypothetical protein
VHPRDEADAERLAKKGGLEPAKSEPVAPSDDSHTTSMSFYGEPGAKDSNPALQTKTASSRWLGVVDRF